MHPTSYLASFLLLTALSCFVCADTQIASSGSELQSETNVKQMQHLDMTDGQQQKQDTSQQQPLQQNAHLETDRLLHSSSSSSNSTHPLNTQELVTNKLAPISDSEKQSTTLIASKRAAPRFIGKRLNYILNPGNYLTKEHIKQKIRKAGPFFMGKRQFSSSDYAKLNRYRQFVERRGSPRFVGKRSAHRLIEKRSAPMFIEMRGSPRFVGKRELDDMPGYEMYDINLPSYPGPIIEDELTETDELKRFAPRFIGKRDNILPEADQLKRAAPRFIGKRDNILPEADELKRAAPRFIGKRAAPRFIGRRAGAPRFIGKRGPPRFIGKKMASLFDEEKRAAPRFIGKRNQFEIIDPIYEEKESDIAKRVKDPRDYMIRLLKQKMRRAHPRFIGKRTPAIDFDDISSSEESNDDAINLKRDAPRFVGKRKAPMFVGRRAAPKFVGRGGPPMFVGRRAAPRFIGKRKAPMFVGKRAAPRFIGKRKAPMFVGKRAAPRFIGKREPEDFEYNADVYNVAGEMPDENQLSNRGVENLQQELLLELYYRQREKALRRLGEEMRKKNAFLGRRSADDDETIEEYTEDDSKR